MARVSAARRRRHRWTLRARRRPRPARAGTLEFHDLLVLARRVLTRSASARRILHDRYQRVLLDEFQDTDPIQLEIAILLTSLPESSPSTAHPVPGRLFVVGNPKQSIYRFRRADIAVYLGAAARIDAEEVALSANFRSTDAVIDWVNGVFRGRHPIRAGRAAGLPRPRGGPGRLDGPRHRHRARRRRPRLGPRRRRTALVRGEGRGRSGGHGPARGLDGRRRGRRLRPCRPGDIAVLLPARTSLPMLERSLAGLDVPYRAENASVVYLAPEIRHVMLALRAAADPTDELALVATLRSPLYGCSNVDLYDWRRGGGRWNLSAAARPEAIIGGAVADGIAHLRTIAERAGRLGPADLVDALVVERRVLEVALAGPDARDVWRRVRFVVDQARAWTEAGGRGLRRYLRWTRFRPARAGPATRSCPSATTTPFASSTSHGQGPGVPRHRRRRPHHPQPGSPVDVRRLADRDVDAGRARRPAVRVGPAPGRGDGRRRAPPLALRRLHPHRRPPRRVAPPQARDRVQGPRHPHVDQRLGAGDRRSRRPRRRLVRRVGGAAGPDAGEPAGAAVGRSGGVGRGTSTGRAGGGGALDDERHRVAAAMPLGHRRRRAGGARRIGRRGGRDSDLLALAVDAGLAKGPVDLDLPPWQRGRYGTAIGRAVHAVLQDADLDDGHDIDHLAAAHAAAEGIFGLESTVAALSRSALGAPVGPGRRRRRRPLARAVRRRRARRAPCSRATSTSSSARRTVSSSSTTRPTTSAVRATGPSAWPATASSSPRTAWPSARSSPSRSSAGSWSTAAPTARPSSSTSPTSLGALAAVRAPVLR